MPSIIPEISIKDYSYTLPDTKIALQPLQDRSASKMLVFQSGIIHDKNFKDLPDVLPEDSFIVLNETKVINARLHFTKKTGGKIEIFCLNPDSRYLDITEALQQKGQVCWQCIIGGRKKWKDEKESIHLAISATTILQANIIADADNTTLISFNWNDLNMSFAEVLALAGDVPLPPYIKRDIEESDKNRYQTVFAKNDGSVAAPTASLHITEAILDTLNQKGHTISKINLHVGAGTFMPVKEDNISTHIMHEEWIEISENFIDNWLHYLSKGTKNDTVAIGTTACRTLESLYWIGVKILNKDAILWQEKALEQWEAYTLPQHYSLREAITAIKQYMLIHTVSLLQTKTQLLILPGYTFRSIDILVTNFHQPESTLLLLVAAFTQGHYKKVYQHALANEYRFLSYGDGSVLFK